MKSENQIKQLAKDIRLKPDADVDERILTFAEAKLAKPTKSHDIAELRRPSIRRQIMKSPFAKIAAVAVIFVAILAGLPLLDNEGVALADVLTKIEQITAYMYKMSMTKTRLSQLSTSTKSMDTIWISKDHGMRATRETIDPNNESTHQDIYILPHKKTLVMVEHQKKSYQRFKLNDTMTERFKEEYSDPRTMIKEMLSCEYISLGQSVIDGINVEGFQTTDPTHSMSKVYGQPADVKVWVDAETRLPVRSEVFIAAEADGGVREHRVLDNFRWNVPVDAAKFEPNIPDDYTTRGDITIPAYTEETAIKGLRVFADLVGDYPDYLGGKTFAKSEFFKELEKLIGPAKTLSQSEKYKNVTDITMPIAGLVSFYKTLVQDGKDAAYYGEFVTPKDADKVLLRWKVSDEEYRVIYGDLHAETVTPEKLAELEAALPK